MEEDDFFVLLSELVCERSPHLGRVPFIFPGDDRRPRSNLIERVVWSPARVKIGRSRDVEKRKRSLEASQDFQVVIRRVFHGKGPYEVVLHRALRKFRSKRGPGKEWFRLSSQEAERCISKTLLRRRLWSMRRSGRRPFSRSACLTPRRQPCKDEFLKSRESAKLAASPVSSHAPEEEFRSCTRSGYP